MTTNQTSPYLLEEPPTSVGKALLARAFEHWCGLHHGHSGEEIAAAFEPDGALAPEVRKQITFAARLIGELIAAGEVRTFARPFGGGSPERVPASHWELDDFRQRFALSAINPKMPFATDAEPTHWIFVELEDFNRIVEESCADIMPKCGQAARGDDVREGAPGVVFTAVLEDRHVRMPELERRTGMSRSTIYRRIEAGRFPSQIPMDGTSPLGGRARSPSGWPTRVSCGSSGAGRRPCPATPPASVQNAARLRDARGRSNRAPTENPSREVVPCGRSSGPRFQNRN